MTLPEYSNFHEKNQLYNSVKVETVSQFKTQYDFMAENANHLIFRGLNEARFKNYTSGQRAWITNRLRNQISYVDFIQKILDNIKSNKVLLDYYVNLNVVPNDLLYLSFLQHYGAPTPMLDFTRDLDTALFFAFDNMKPNSTRNLIGDFVSLYYIDINECGNELVNMIDLYKDSVYHATEMLEDFRVKNPDVNVNDELIRNIAELVRWGTSSGFSNIDCGLYDGIFSKDVIQLPLSGQRLVWSNMNIIAQKGCFINYNNPKKPFEQYLANHKQLPKMHCVNIPKSFSDYIKLKIGKTRADIYPQEEDFAKSSYFDYLKSFQ